MIIGKIQPVEQIDLELTEEVWSGETSTFDSDLCIGGN